MDVILYWYHMVMNLYSNNREYNTIVRLKASYREYNHKKGENMELKQKQDKDGKPSMSRQRQTASYSCLYTFFMHVPVVKRHCYKII